MNHKKYLGPYRGRRRHHPQPYRGNPHQPPGPHQPNVIFFQGNLAQSMRFGAKDHELSGYVQRKLVLIDQHGNKQIATEKQFFNSGQKIGRIRVSDDDSEGEF
jgi:hypothetical protein